MIQSGVLTVNSAWWQLDESFTDTMPHQFNVFIIRSSHSQVNESKRESGAVMYTVKFLRSKQMTLLFDLNILSTKKNINLRHIIHMKYFLKKSNSSSYLATFISQDHLGIFFLALHWCKLKTLKHTRSWPKKRWPLINQELFMRKNEISKSIYLYSLKLSIFIIIMICHYKFNIGNITLCVPNEIEPL